MRMIESITPSFRQLIVSRRVFIADLYSVITTVKITMLHKLYPFKSRGMELSITTIEQALVEDFGMRKPA